MKTRHKVMWWIAIAVPIVIVGAAVAVVGRQIRQDRLNYDLYNAIVDLDVPAVTQLLEDGADANTLYPLEGPQPPPGLRDILRRMFQRSNQAQSSPPDMVPALLWPLSPFGSHERSAYKESTGGVDPDDAEAAAITIALLRHSAKPNAVGPGNMTALHWAAAYNYRTVAETLLKFHADTRIADGSGRTALEIAAEDSPEVARVLISGGANPKLPGIVQKAIRNSDFELAVRLVKLGANASGAFDDAEEDEDRHFSFARAAPASLEFLLNHGLDANGLVLPTSSRTLLLAAVIEHAPFPIIKLLLKHGAVVTLRDEDGLSAIDYAKSQYHSVIPMLMAAAKAKTRGQRLVKASRR